MLDKYMKEQVFKIQMPIVGNTILVYNKHQEYFSQLPITKDLKKFMNGELKKYVYGYVNKDKELVIEREAPEQEW